MQKSIAHLDMDTFFVSCERLINPALNNLPLIIGGNSDRSVVASCSYEARRFGVRSAMPMQYARRLCPQAKVVRGDMELYSNKSNEITSIIEEKAPVFEKASIDEFYLDVTGMDRFFGCYQWTDELTTLITKETGLPVSFALSVNKTVSKIGSGEAKPAGKMEILNNMVRPFLNPLPIQKIPQLGDVTFKLLSRIGVRNIQTLAEMPAESLQELIGKNGLTIWERANGIDYRSVEPYTERKSISSEHTFQQDTIDIFTIKTLLTGMVEKLAFQLRSEEWLTSCVVIKIRYNNFDTETRQTRIPYTAFDHILRERIFDLFEKVYKRRMRIRLVGVRFTGLVRGSYQIDMFQDTTEVVALYQAIDKIKNKFGSASVKRGSALLPKENDQ